MTEDQHSAVPTSMGKCKESLAILESTAKVKVETHAYVFIRRCGYLT